MKSERRGIFIAVGVLLLSAVLGGIYGPNVRATAASADDYQTAVRNFTRVLDTVESNYADPVDVDKAVYQGAIPGMLRMLDPHSSFFDAKQFSLLREEDLPCWRRRVARLGRRYRSGWNTSRNVFGLRPVSCS